MARSYRLIAEEVPPTVKAAVYGDALSDFLLSKQSSVRVEMPKKKPATVHQGLLKAKRVDPRFASVAIVRRGSDVYLKRQPERKTA